ncbi:hypothetical protein CV014_06720 [Nostoc sp. CMAA1605]|nr:hypothetical protein [Nostoc sp. CMAA1605]
MTSERLAFSLSAREGNREWGMGNGDWGLGTGDKEDKVEFFTNAQCPMPNALFLTFNRWTAENRG